MRRNSGCSGTISRNTSPTAMKGQAGWYIVRVDTPDDAVRVAKAIDAEFANSAYETKTETESAFAASWVKQFGNIQFLMVSIGMVVFFTLLLVTGNTMAISVRERTGELAVFKAIGFSDRAVLLFVLGGIAADRGPGRAAGPAACRWRMPVLAKALSGMLPSLVLPPSVFAMGFAIALAVGLASGLLPGLGAMRLQIVNALAEGLTMADIVAKLVFGFVVTLAAVFVLLIFAGLRGGIAGAVRRVCSDFLQLPQHPGALDFNDRRRARYRRNRRRVRGHAFAGQRFPGHAGRVRFAGECAGSARRFSLGNDGRRDSRFGQGGAGRAGRGAGCFGTPGHAGGRRGHAVSADFDRHGRKRAGSWRFRQRPADSHIRENR